MSKAVRESIEKAVRLLSKREVELGESALAELKQTLQTVIALGEERTALKVSLKVSLKEADEILEASAKELRALVRGAKRVATASEKAKKAKRLARG
ncbi:MAG: hypothetical protein M0Z80_03490 [Treponema sp.]|nr:hypothetical protein [Treponema sp.]